jgi:hypothetical protein
LLALGGEVAEQGEGVGLDPVGIRQFARVHRFRGRLRGIAKVGDVVAVEFEIAFGDFQSCSGGVDSGNAAAGAGEMQGEATLIAADVEGGSFGGRRGWCGGGVESGGGIVVALIEEGSGFLSGAGVVMKAEAIEGEDGGFVFGGSVGRVGGDFGVMLVGAVTLGVGAKDGAGEVERLLRRDGKLLEDADARVGTLEDGTRAEVGVRKFRGERLEERARDGFADVGEVEALGEYLDEDEVVVAIDDEAGELVGFGEDEAGGICGSGEKREAAGDGGGDALFEEGEEGIAIGEFVGREEAEGDLGGGGVESGSVELVAAIEDA